MADSDLTKVINEKYHFCILLLLTASQFVMSLGAYAWGPLAPFLRAEFDITRAQTGSIVSALYAVSVIVAMPSGVAVDRWGAKAMLIIALLVMGISFGAMSMVNSFIMFTFIAGISGVGYGMINQISSKGIIQWFDKKNRATAMGIKQTGVTLGGALGAVMLPAIALASGRKWATMAAGVLMVATAVLVLFYYRESPSDKGAGGNAQARTNSTRRRDFSVVLKKPELMVICIVSMLLAASQTCIASFVVLYMQEELLTSAAVAGICLSVFMIAGTAGRVLWGLISDRIFRGDRQAPMIVVCLIAAASAAAMAFTGRGCPVWLPYVLSALMGFSFMGWNALFITFSAEIAGHALVGLVTGLTVTVAWTGIIAGPPIFGFIADKFGYIWSWSMLAVFGLFCTVCLLYSTKVSEKSPAAETGC